MDSFPVRHQAAQAGKKVEVMGSKLAETATFYNEFEPDEANSEEAAAPSASKANPAW
jgi:hypothetical protein